MSAGLGGCNASSPPEQGPGKTKVQVTAVREAPLEQTLNTVGGLSSPQQTLLATQIDGRITELHIRQGQVVQQGQLLVVLDDGLQQAAINTAQADLDNARQIYQRDLRVKDTGGLSAQKLQSDEAALRRAEAQLQQARTNLDYTRVKAPFTGALGLRQVSLGAFVKAGASLVSIHQVDPLHLDFSLPQDQLSRVQVGQIAEFDVAGLDGSFRGKVTTVDTALAVGSRSLVLQATVDNPGQQLKPGMFARVRLVVDVLQNALFVPMQALTAEGQVNHLWVVGKDDKAERRTVKVGEYRDNWVQILSGVSAEDRVVASGIQKLQPGVPLQISSYEPIHNPRLDLAPPKSGQRP